MMKKLLIVIGCGFLFVIVACHGNDTVNTKSEKSDTAYAIIGKVTGQDSGWIYIVHRQTGKIDSTALDHGYFKFSGKADTAEYCRISLNDQIKGFFLENGKISMLIKKDSVADALISGTRIQDEFNYFHNTTSKSLNDRMAAVDKAYDEAEKKKNTKVTDSLEKVYELLSEEQKQLAVAYAKLHPGSLLSSYELYSNFFYNPRLGQIDSLYHILDTNGRATFYGVKLKTLIDKTKITAIGNPAPDFSENDMDGNPVTLSSFKGSYVLVDFWASWCGPCRRENPNVVKAYNQYKKKGFDIFGVSLDDDKDAWIKAIKKDKLDWTQVSDLKAWKADVVSLYGINGIPMNYLLDKNGIIIAKGLRGEDLNKKLAELLH